MLMQYNRWFEQNLEYGRECAQRAALHDVELSMALAAVIDAVVAVRDILEKRVN